MKKNILLFIFVCSSLLAQIFAFDINNQTPKTVRVAVVQYLNFFNVDDNNDISGYGKEFLSTISKYTNWDIEFVLTSWAEAHNMLINGQIDIVPFVQYTDERRKEYRYSKYPIGRTKTLLLTLPQKQSEFVGSEYSYLNNKIISDLYNSVRVNKIEEIIKENNITTKIVRHNTYRDQIKALENGEVDIIISDSINYDNSLFVLDALSTDSYYLITNKNNTVLADELDRAMAKILSLDTYYEAYLYEKYHLDTQEYIVQLSKEETDYINNAKPINIAIPENIPPLFYEKDQEIVGIIPDIFEHFSKETGLKFNFTNYQTHLAAITAVNSGEAQILACVYDSFSIEKKYKLIYSMPFMNAFRIIVQNKRNKIDLNNGLQAQPNYHLQFDYNFTNIPFSENVITFDSLKDCLFAVNSGKADFSVCNFYSFQYYSKKYRLYNLFATSIDKQANNFSFAYSQKTDPILIDIIDKEIKYNKNKTIQQIIYSNATNSVYSPSLSDILYDNPQSVVLYALIVVVIIIIFILLIILNHTKKIQNTILVKSNIAKTEFLSRMSHEMRTPLSAIIGLNTIASDNYNNKRVVIECCRKIKMSSTHLLQIINDVLDMSMIDKGKLTLNETSFSMYVMIKTISTLYQELALSKHLSFTTIQNIHPNCFLISDELRLKQVIINLISNAIKYNKPNGKICFTIDKIPSDIVSKKYSGFSSDNYEFVRFTISDTGIGIKKENLSTIFETFEREQNSDRQSINGSGLGLTISSQIVKLMNTEINVKSEVGIGSTFWFDVVLKKDKSIIEIDHLSKEETILPSDTQVCDLSGYHILIAEDEEINADVIQYFLECYHAETTVAKNGKECVEYFLNSAIDYYNLILMDIRMPVMDGYEATKQIRSSKRKDASTVKIIALSANAFNSDIDQSIDSGMNAHCSKPIDKNDLIKKILSLK